MIKKQKTLLFINTLMVVRDIYTSVSCNFKSDILVVVYKVSFNINSIHNKNHLIRLPLSQTEDSNLWPLVQEYMLITEFRFGNFVTYFHFKKEKKISTNNLVVKLIETSL